MAPRPTAIVLSSSSPARPVSTSSSPSTARQSQSPFRYVHFTQDIDEKSTPLSDLSSSVVPSVSPSRISPSSSSRLNPQSSRQLRPQSASPFVRQPQNTSTVRHPSTYSRPRGLRISNLIKPWIPIIMYGLTSLAFLIAIAFYKTEVFAGLDELSRWLQADLLYGYTVLFLLIFLTTIPPIPLYSTLITLSGYTFGAIPGAILSYFSALAGALTVFILCRVFMRECISRWLATTCTLKRVIRAIEKRPKLLFLIRLAPYPYNVMNALLAAAPTLSLRTYTIATALSLFKVIIHTSLGASIHSFKNYHAAPDKVNEDMDLMAHVWTILGIALCIAIFVYLSSRRKKSGR
ncbi:hypothetical protein C8J56DRAFT_1047450 [Mycena floridula]|nr:hypothetical protein C8J56DRAFT_1047450 [Mycena floridula]